MRYAVCGSGRQQERGVDLLVMLKRVEKNASADLKPYAFQSLKLASAKSMPITDNDYQAFLFV